MKKYITVAALLVAGTAFANAEESTTVEFNINRDGNSVTFFESNDFVSLEYTKWTYSGAGDNSEGNFVDSTVSNYVNTFSPNGQLRANQAGDSWTMNFSIKNTGSEVIVLESITFTGYVINSDGSSKTGNISEMTLTATLTDCNSNARNAIFATGGNTGSVEFFFTSPVEVGVNESKVLAFTLSNAIGYNTYAGLTGGSVTYSIPEPSAFGMLAGVGALALVAARRRRK